MPSFSLFDHASPALLAWFKGAGTKRTLEAGSTLIREGQASECLSVLLNGSLSVTTTNRQELQDQLATLSPGSLVGEMSWLEQRPAVASVTAREASTVLELPVRQLERFDEERVSQSRQTSTRSSTDIEIANLNEQIKELTQVRPWRAASSCPLVPSHRSRRRALACRNETFLK